MVRQAWLDWIAKGKKVRRRLVVQVINALRLSYAWNGLEVALKNLEIVGLYPDTSPEAIKQAVELCQRLGWDAKSIREDFR